MLEKEDVVKMEEQLESVMEEYILSNRNTS